MTRNFGGTDTRSVLNRPAIRFYLGMSLQREQRIKPMMLLATWRQHGTIQYPIRTLS
jgi:hypothetical protein